MTYDDGLIACAPDALTIRRYGLILRSKRIAYAQIRSVQEIPLGLMRRWRLWGTTDPRRWFNLDVGRRRKQVAFIVDIGKQVTPVITPDDPQRFVAVLRSHGVQVEER